ncbi:uncharacterized protein LOC122554537 isoform X2 [Chiloscyllium plagiosum]|uniref:uncharacterized protein LOC122554537 isoform X2 n=1 Tax=Chiloscyllium plagiosum TaxID=36176 RepID=UPI001CB7C342|nr:uncharacterized protein LOC122554537 isoform X2 [Chiloscyllium plagiosum]
MDSFETDVNRNTTNELDISDNEELLEKMDDYQFATFVENCCVNLQQSHDILDEDCIKQTSENSLMWEKSFEHSILLDMDDDFNLNFSEICDSYTIFLSQSSAEDDSLNITTDDIDKIENEYDGSDEDEIYSTKETKYEENQHICRSSYSDQNDERQENSENSFQENKLQDLQDNTTDEEQEELPYDGHLQNVSEHPTDEHPDLVDHMLPLTRLVRNQSAPLPVSRVTQTIPLSHERSTVENSFFCQEMPENQLSTEAEDSNHRSKSETNTFFSEDTVDALVSRHETKLESSVPVEHNQLYDGRSNITESLQYYFSEEDLALNSTMYIDSETLPETSFTDSVEETVIKNHVSSIASNNLPININKFTLSEADLSSKQRVDSKFATEKKVFQAENDSCYNAHENMENNCTCGPVNSPKLTQEENTQAPINLETISEIAQNPILKTGRTISYNEIKYGKGKQHYPQLDFSKVESKVKIPKRTTSNNYNLERPIIKKAKSSANVPESSHATHKSKVDVTQVILDSTQSSIVPTRTKVNSKIQSVNTNHTPELFQQLQEEFDKLLIKYAEAENTIDQLRFGAKVSENSVSNQNQMLQSGLLSSSCQVINSAGSQQHETQSGSASHSIIFSPSVISAGTKPDSCQPFAEVHKATEAEQMAQELNEHIEYFKHQVEDFQKRLNSESVSLEDVQWEFKKLRDGQEKLERRYIATKDEHRSLQQRRYLDNSIIVGEFDPDREMDGEIFRTGMQLENMKEKIDEYICIQASPNNSIMTTPHSTNHSLSSENTVAAVIQEGLGVVLVTQDSFQKDVKQEETPKRNGNLSVPEDRDNPIQQRDLIKYSKLPTEGMDFSVPEEKLVSNFLMPLASIPTIDDQSCRRISEIVVNDNENQLEQDPQSLELQTSTVSTKAPSTLLDNNFHASVYPSNSFMNQTLILHSTSLHEQELSNELKIILPDNGIAGSESCRPHTAIHTLDSEQPQTERYSNVCENMHSCKRGLHNGSNESTHTTENIMENDNKVRQLLQMADPSGCTNPLKWHEPIIGVTDLSAAADLDLLTESSEDHIPLPIPQQCKSKTLLQQTNCGEKENEDLSQSWSTKNEEVLELQNEVSKLKQSLRENLSKLSNVSPSQRQRYRTRSCHSEKFSSTRCEEDVKLTTNFLNSLKRRSCSWQRGDKDASNPKLNNRMEDLFFSDTQISVYAKQGFLEKPRTAHHRRSYSEGHKSTRTWLKGSYKGLQSSTNGLNLHRPKMNSCFLCSKKTPHKILSEGSSGQSRHGLTSSLGISATAPNKYSEIFASISPLRYDTIEYPPISNGSRIYYSPTCEIDNVRSPVLPNQFCSTKSLLRGNIEKSNINAQEILHLNTTLDRAIETANNMKKTTRRMIKILSADLAKAEYYKYLYDF